MEPFELMDLIGIDIGLEVTRSMWEQSFGEPRWRPSPLQTRMVSAGRLGRKSGGGFREAGDEPAPAVPDTTPPAAACVLGADPVARELRERLGVSGVAAVTPDDPACGLIVAFGETEQLPARSQGRPALALSCGHSSAEQRWILGACGFQLLGPLPRSPLVELAEASWVDPGDARTTASLFSALGFDLAPAADTPGLVLGRIVAQLVNEASFAVAAGIAPAGAVDQAMTLGLSHPRGPFAWAEANGSDSFVHILDALRREDGDPRYRVAPSLRRCALAETPPKETR
jgi:3-hydroxybutyryl-CoA dehydrogenase